MNKKDKIYIAGHNGMVGRSLVKLLTSYGYTNILTVSSDSLDLRNQSSVNHWFEANKPDHVFLLAAKVGGIGANNKYPANFLYDNIAIQTNVIHASHINNVKKLLFLGSSCIYPKQNNIPITEDQLLSGKLESTNEAYALAKITGLKMCEYYMNQYGRNFISAMPCNLYGPNDNFDIEYSHVIPALLTKFHAAKLENKPEITVWGTGIARREFLYVDDLSEAIYLLMQVYDYKPFLNIGSGIEVSMKNLFELISQTVCYSGTLLFDTSKPDGTITKLIDSSTIRGMGWGPKVSLKCGIKNTYDWYLNNIL